MQRKKLPALLCSLCFCMLLGGCAFSTPAEKLYRLPKLPAEYESLELRIEEILAQGAEHVAPTSGSRLQSVQMVDLDADGSEEALAFFRKTSDEKPMKIYVFKAVEKSYEQYALIEGTASSLYSVDYNDLNGDGSSEIFIGFKSGTGLQVLSVYSLKNGVSVPLLTTVYSRYTIFDAESDRQPELAVFYGDEEGMCTVDCYLSGETELRRISSVKLAFSDAELRAVESGALASGEPALFATGIAEDSIAITSILTLKEDGNYKTLKKVGDEGGEVFRFLDLYPTDINSDGIVEIPEPNVFPTSDLEGEAYYRINWRQYDASGASETVYRSFHNNADGWRLALKESWDGVITLRRKASAEENSVTFLLLRHDGEAVPFMAVHTITGEAREVRASRGGRFVLARQVDTVYAAEFLEGNGLIAEAMDEQELRDSFALLVSEWTTGEN